MTFLFFPNSSSQAGDVEMVQLQVIKYWNHVLQECFSVETGTFIIGQSGHSTGKTGNLVLTFSRQGKHKEFCCDTGENFETQGKYFDCVY